MDKDVWKKNPLEIDCNVRGIFFCFFVLFDTVLHLLCDPIEFIHAIDYYYGRYRRHEILCRI